MTFHGERGSPGTPGVRRERGAWVAMLDAVWPMLIRTIVIVAGLAIVWLLADAVRLSHHG